jgi:hypothetical protein
MRIKNVMITTLGLIGVSLVTASTVRADGGIRLYNNTAAMVSNLVITAGNVSTVERNGQLSGSFAPNSQSGVANYTNTVTETWHASMLVTPSNGTAFHVVCNQRYPMTPLPNLRIGVYTIQGIGGIIGYGCEFTETSLNP